VTLSSVEVEHVAVTTTACQIVWMRRIVIDLLQEQ
jgi:hypothetical protein